jgi:ribosomal protein L37E
VSQKEECGVCMGFGEKKVRQRNREDKKREHFLKRTEF